MEVQEAISLGIATLAAVGALLAYFKRKPGQKEKDEVTVAEGNINVAQGTLNIAQGTIELVTETLEKRFRTMNDDMSEQYRFDTDARIAELTAELRGERAENQRLRLENDELKSQVRENAELRARVSGLEAEVAQLKARQ
jgi:uncharacterized protein YceH (UPF0502 family)